MFHRRIRKPFPTIQSTTVHRNVTRCGVVFVFLLALLGGPSSAAERREDEGFTERSHVHFRLDLSKLFTAKGKGAHQAPPPHASPEPTLGEIKAGQQGVMTALQARGNRPLDVGDTLKVYAAAGKGGFHSIHGLLGNGIDTGVSRQLGQNRQAFHDEVLDALTLQIREKTPQLGVGINDFGASGDPDKVNAKTDIDFTLYPQFEGIDAGWLVEQYRKLFQDISERKYGVRLTPEQMDIVAHRYDASIPDYRQQHSIADFLFKIRNGRSQLKRNHEAYFLEGAFQQQVMGRSVSQKGKTFMQLTAGEGGEVVRKMLHASEIPLYFYKPSIKPRHAFGGAMGNTHFYRVHQGDVQLEAKYLLRALDEGPGIALRNKQREYIDILDADQRRQMLGALYDDPSLGLSARTREKMVLAYEVARNLRLAHKQNRPPSDADFEPLVGYHRDLVRERGKVDKRVLLAEAKSTFRDIGPLILTSNTLLSAQDRFKDWAMPDREERIPFIDEDGTETMVRPTRDQITKLQFGAFYEIRDSLEIMNPTEIKLLKARMAKQNPRFAEDIEIVERLIQAEREMMLPANDDALEILKLRENAANAVLDSFDALTTRTQGAGTWKNALQGMQNAWATGAALESYLQTRFVDALTARAGDKYKVLLNGMRLDAMELNQRAAMPTADPRQRSLPGKVVDTVFGNNWMTRMGRANSVVYVLTVYTEEGEVNAKVVKAAIREAFSHLPLLGMAVDIEMMGVGKTLAQITLSQTIPGYGQVMLVVSTAKGVVNLGGTLIFAPLKRDKIMLAYQGWLPAGTLRRVRVESPRPALLHPIDPDRDKSLEERRQGVYAYFRPRILEVFERTYPGGTIREMDDTYAALEGEQLPVVMGKYVDDWWHGTGIFAGDDSLTVRRMMEEHYGDEMRAKLVHQLISDYMDYKRYLVAMEEQRQAIIMQLMAQAAARDEAGRRQFEAWRAEIREGHQAMARMEVGRLQQEVPRIEPRIEILASPKVRTATDSRGRPIDLIEDINFRAKVSASPSEQHPGPFQVRWEVSDGGQTHTLVETRHFKTEQAPERAPKQIVVTATVLDANGRPLISDSMTLPLAVGDPLRGEDNCDEPASVSDVMHCLEQAVVEARALGDGIDESCRAASRDLAATERDVGQAEARIRTLTEQHERLQTLVQQASRHGGGISQSHQAAEAGALALEQAKDEAEQVSNALCNRYQQLLDSADQQSYQRLRGEISPLQSRLRQLDLQGATTLNQVQGHAHAASRSLANLETSIRQLRALLSQGDDQLDQRALLDRLIEADMSLVAARDALDSLRTLRQRAEHNAKRGGEMLKIESDPRLVAQRTQEMDALLEQVRRIEKEHAACVDDTSRKMAALSGTVERLGPGIAELQVRRTRLLQQAAPVIDAVSVQRSRDQAGECGFLKDLAGSHQARVHSAAERGEGCATQAGNTRWQPAEPDIGNLLRQQDCRWLPGSIAGYDPASQQTICLCGPGTAYNDSRNACINCDSYNQAALDAHARGNLREARRIVGLARNCDFAAQAMAVIDSSRNLQQMQAETDCLRRQNAVWGQLNSRNYNAAVQSLHALQRDPGCQPGHALVDAVRHAIDLQRQQEQNRRDQQNLDAMLNTLANITRQISQPPPRPPTVAWPGPASGGGQPPTQRQPPPPQTSGGGASQIDCEKRFCPVCGNDDIVLLGQSTDAQCMDCKRRNKARIEDCMAGGRAASQPDAQISAFRNHYVMRCSKRVDNRTVISFHVKGPSAPPIPYGAGSCTVYGQACTLVECKFQAERMNAARR